MAGLTHNHRLLKQANEGKEVNAEQVFFIDRKTYVGTKFLELFFNVSERQIRNWKKKGFKESKHSQTKLTLFDLNYAIQWNAENISKSASKKTDSRRNISFNPDGTKNESNLPIDEVSKDEAERRQLIMKAKNEEIKYKEAVGELIPAEDQDRAMAELAAIHLSQYQNDKKLLPIILEKKSKQEIISTLDEHYADRIDTMDKLVHKEMDIPASMYDIILEAVESLNFGIKMGVLLEKIKNLRTLKGDKNE